METGGLGEESICDLLNDLSWVGTSLRPCGTFLYDNESCLEMVPVNNGDVMCHSGHTTFNTPRMGEYIPKGELANKPILSWIMYDDEKDKCIKIHLSETHKNEYRLFYGPSKVFPIVRYGSEDISSRKIVFTNHANKRLTEKEISVSDVERVLVEGELIQIQPRLVHRVEGVDSLGRKIGVCYRLNSLHEVVVVTTFVIQG